jgi:hypothetical protein
MLWPDTRRELDGEAVVGPARITLSELIGTVDADPRDRGL